jgi:hypothetical protein
MNSEATTISRAEQVLPLEQSHLARVQLRRSLDRQGYAMLTSEQLCSLMGSVDAEALADWSDFQDSWQRLEQDHYMGDGGTYRYRRHAVFHAAAGGGIRGLAHQPHYQSTDYNRLNGGIARHFAPIEPAIADSKVLRTALALCQRIFAGLQPGADWQIEVHQFRILASQSQAMPTPEGIHRDGVSYVFMLLVNRVHVQHGVSRIYDTQLRELACYTLATPLEAAIVDDERTLHAVTPILASEAVAAGYRDMLVITFKRC